MNLLKCAYCEERPAQPNRFYCIECDVTREPVLGVMRNLARAEAIVEAQCIIRDHQRRNQV